MFKPIDIQELAYYEMVSENRRLSEEFLKVLEDMLTNERENGGHTGFTIHYVVPTLRRWFKEEVIEGSNTVTARTMNIFNTYKGEDKELLIDIFEALLLYKPLSPLTFNRSEFNEPDHELDSESISKQNKRCSAVFMDKGTNRPWYLHAIVFSEDVTTEDGSPYALSFTGNGVRLGSVDGPKIGSSAYIKKNMYYKNTDLAIRCEPKQFYIKTVKIGDENVVIDVNQLKKVKKYYHIEYRK